MSTQSLKGNKELAKRIKDRRMELGLTIEEAANKAGVGSKTWSRYEAGESIRKDKCLGICRVLKWKSITDENTKMSDLDKEIKKYKKQKYWSVSLEKTFGTLAAYSFSVGSELLLSDIQEDLELLSHLPRGSHLGQVDCSVIYDSLPEQFKLRYDYDFLFALKQAITGLRNTVFQQQRIIAHSVIEELALYLIVEDAQSYIEIMECDTSPYINEEETDWEHWIYAIFDDMDIVSFLYSDFGFLSPDHTYHFDHWLEVQFYTE